MTVLRVEVRQFNKQTFMDSIEGADRPFYEKVGAGLITPVLKSKLQSGGYTKLKTHDC